MSRPSPPNYTNSFRDLRANFETRSQPTIATAYRSISAAAGDTSANTAMSSQQQQQSRPQSLPPAATRRVPSLAKSIDTILDTPPASPPPTTPTLSTATSTRPAAPPRLRPSWIGPPKQPSAATPGPQQTMKQNVTVEYSAPGLQPPVYICTSLSEPPWEAIEMHRDLAPAPCPPASTKSDPAYTSGGGYVFSKTFCVEEGEYQYKFRLGEGDWWVCDEGRPMVDDGCGNKNNLLIVKAEGMLVSKVETAAGSTKGQIVGNGVPKAPDVVPPTNAPKAPEVVPLPQQVLPPVIALTSSTHDVQKPGTASVAKPEATSTTAPASTRHDSPELAPLLKHETFRPLEGAMAQQTPETEASNPLEDDDGDLGDPHPGPLLSHETFKPLAPDESTSDSEDDDSDSSSSSEDDDGEDEGKARASSKTSEEADAAPLFRHETMMKPHGVPPIVIPTKNTSTAVNNSAIPQEATHHDLHLEKFPVHHAGIIDQILETRHRLPEDQFSEEHLFGSPTSQVICESPISPATRVRATTAEEVLEKIREAEEEEYEKEQEAGQELDPLRLQEPEDADFTPKVEVDMVEKIEIEEHVVIEVVEQRKGLAEVLLERMGGKGNAM
ncbi:hypothetical protein BDY17DRAFT_311289 [Neohortaea acidophila]|uniref:AMP-activated protein kinase glycogen-binding domain-containing protein n=1 Tax=Neohortaea acidophila TaxID=245834 RepID=A0A6A6PQV1_9PEZI|nr:uncharacterized protein BDY17DRAFT_311289 [Neohortaea acidophila]KAF2481617.1 hypothetical protein BDY17DRAFT_311289 [Neohortaea acidophila]